MVRFPGAPVSYGTPILENSPSWGCWESAPTRSEPGGWCIPASRTLRSFIAYCPRLRRLSALPRGKDHANVATVTGLLVSWAGCLLAVLAGPSAPGRGLGSRRCTDLTVYPDDVLLPGHQPEHH